ncbi:MAG TPA: aminopeptidase P family protein [Thermoanaerobacterales bacterium]|nr:aminopeptidase P family protein [Thermoanaerobacterales bacterium]
MSWSKTEFETKLQRIRKLMERSGIQNLSIGEPINFLWLTGGRPYVNIISPKACADLLVNQDKVYLFSSNIEAQRLKKEELSDLSIEVVEYSWWEPTAYKDTLAKITQGSEVYSDSQMGEKFSRLRWELLPEEQERYMKTGKCASKIIEEVAFSIKPGDTELEVAKMIKKISAENNFYPWVNLVAADDRAYNYRHPLPTEKPIEKYVLLAISGHKYGLMTSLTRLVHFGKVPEDLRKRHQAVLKVDAAFIGATKPDVKVKEIFEAGKTAYEQVGFGNEWHYHHQGGMAGYNSREFRASSHCEETVAASQAYAWNPSIAGTKSEDTILVTESGPSIVTKAIQYPVTEVEYKGESMYRPDILVR